MASEDLIKSNPFTLSETLELTLSFLPDDEVQKCREVCKLWKKEGDRVLKSRDSVTITSDQDIKDAFERYKKNPKYWISKLILEHYPEADDFPLLIKLAKKVKSQLSELVLENGQISQQRYKQLMRLLAGENILKLVLGDNNLTAAEIPLKYFPIRDFKTRGMLILPKVKWLKYHSFNLPSSEINGSLLSTAAKMFPNLIKLKVYDMPYEKISNFNEIRLPHLKFLNVEQLSNHLRVDYPNFEPGLTERNVKCLLKLELNLKSLTLSNVNNSLKPELLKELLESQKELEELDLSQYSLDQTDPFSRLPAPCPFPLSLPSLTNLEVMKPFVRNLNHVFASCPKIEGISLTFHENADWDSVLSDRKLKPPATLKKLFILFIDLMSFKRIASSSLSKQITELGLLCNNALLRVLFEKFGNLERLFVKDRITVKAEDLQSDGDWLMTDSGFSGLSQKTLNRLEKQSARELAKNNMEEWMDWMGNICKPLDGNRTQPNIGNLKKLLSLDVDLSPLSSIKTNIPVWGLQNLHKLDLVIFKGKEKINDWVFGMGVAKFLIKNIEESDGKVVYIFEKFY